VAYSAGKNAQLKVTTPIGGGIVDISPYLTSVQGPSVDAQTAEVSTLGDTFKEYIRTQTDPGTISCEGIHDPFMGTLLYALGTAAAAAIEWYPQGSATGFQKWFGTALLTSYAGPGGGIDDAVTFSADFQITSGMTISVI
jgi:hypothetical protein